MILVVGKRSSSVVVVGYYFVKLTVRTGAATSYNSFNLAIVNAIFR